MGVGNNLICSISQLPWCKYSHLGRFQATDLNLLSAESRREAHSPCSRDRVGQLQLSAGSSSLQSELGNLITHHERDVGNDDSIQLVGEVLTAPGLLQPCSYHSSPLANWDGTWVESTGQLDAAGLYHRCLNDWGK